MALADFFNLQSKKQKEEDKTQVKNEEKGEVKKVEVEEKEIKNPDTKNDQEELESEGQLTIDLYEDDKEFIIQSAVAGLKPNEIEIEADKNIIIIKGERKNPAVSLVANKNQLLQECYWGFFKREIMLPSKINIENIKAIFKNGILTIIVPKSEEKQIKKIVIEAEE
ncbi:18 kDa heat shock protein [bacterium HR34]|nr:18 kDa heat shock protein [bacterium HR34]